MGVRKQGQQNIRKITKVGKKLARRRGGSLAVTLPVELVKQLGWREKQKIVVKKVRGGLLIKDWKK